MFLPVLESLSIFKQLSSSVTLTSTDFAHFPDDPAIKYGEEFSIAGSSGKGGKSVDVKVIELESDLIIGKDTKIVKTMTSTNVKYGEDFSIAGSSGKVQNLLMLK